MESFRHPGRVCEKKVSVVGSELVENYTVYIIEVTDGQHTWRVKHRYSDFHDLHEKLKAEEKVDQGLLPPKKMLGKNSKSLVELRQKELELYLQTLLLQFTEAMPTLLAKFLHFHFYEIDGITAALAEELFYKGEKLLQDGKVFIVRPLQLHAVSQQLRFAKPTSCNGDAKTDLGHILDFMCRLRYLKILGSKVPVGTSNIHESSLPFDLSLFKSLHHIEVNISICTAHAVLIGLSCLRPSLTTLSIHHSTETMMSILVPEAVEFSQWEAEGELSNCPITAVIPVWSTLTTLDMSHNSISAIDRSVVRDASSSFAVFYAANDHPDSDLRTSHSQKKGNSSVFNFHHLHLFRHRSQDNVGEFRSLAEAFLWFSPLQKVIPKVEFLDLSHNHLSSLDRIKNIGSLPCLEKLNLSSNPMCIIPDYRTKVLAQFGDRAAEVCLDGQVTTEKELDTVEVLKAIQKARDVKEKRTSSIAKVRFVKPAK
uniref:PX domain-containing protein n=1 Tax=Takifugu rubripes TaxID=31033 RepID=H2TMC7_TAKRU